MTVKELQEQIRDWPAHWRVCCRPLPGYRPGLRHLEDGEAASIEAGPLRPGYTEGKGHVFIEYREGGDDW